MAELRSTYWRVDAIRTSKEDLKSWMRIHGQINQGITFLLRSKYIYFSLKDEEARKHICPP